VAERALIERIGHRGDGIAETANGPIFVPYALPGETVLVERQGPRARLVEVEQPSMDRVEPFCPYFGRCGGCLAQHMGAATYGGWKRGILEGALHKARITAGIDPLIDAHGAGRRRVTFHARMKDGQTRVGYMAAGSHDLVEIAFCPIAEPGLAEAPRAALALARLLERSRKPLDLQVTATETGLDIDIRGHGPLDATTRLRLVEAAAELDLARLSLHGEIIVERRLPSVTMGKARVVPPPGSFLQATAAGEEVLSSLVLNGCEGVRRVADLFAGCGPFTLRLAETREVHAADGDGAALAALDKAARNTPGLRPVKTEVRDLFRRPLLPSELEHFDALVMDPPRAGAEAQARQLAVAAGVPTIVSVSCDAGTFARDAGILIAGGYRLERVVPVDQFKYSAHLELVGLFRSERSGKKRQKR
jgi:23S rRNA (uracil1939-C5)-methyltransferase